MTNYYIEKENKIVFVEMDKDLLQRTVGKDVEIKETERPLVLSEDRTYYVFADTDEYLQEQAQKEAERIAMLNLTAADVERAIYKAKGIDFDDIVATLNSTQPSGIDIKALKIELKATNFYRGNPYVDAVGTLLGFTAEQLNRFFEAGKSDDAEIKADAYLYLTTVTFIVEPIPATATVTINGETATTLAVPYGSTVEYTVTADGYLPQSGSMVVVNNTSIDVELEPEPVIEEPETPVEEEAENETK